MKNLISAAFMALALPGITFASSTAPEKHCTMFEHANFQGRWLKLRPDQSVSFFNGDRWNDKVSSVRVGRGCVLQGYEHWKKQGGLVVIDQGTRLLGNGWNDRISSAECFCDVKG